MTGDFDYVIVGSGAGGGPLAANLAKNGFKVLLMEAGDDPCSQDEAGRLMYEVPIFHGASTEYSACAWNYYVRHYSSDEQQAKDGKKVKIGGRDTVWYPRAGTARRLHRAQRHDYRGSAGQRLERHRANYRRCVLASGTDARLLLASRELQVRAEAGFAQRDSRRNSLVDCRTPQGREDWRDRSHGHGFDGWLPTSEADPKLVLHDPELIILLLNGVKRALLDDVGNPLVRVESRLDPNDSRNGAESPEGLAFTPLAVDKGKRSGPRITAARSKITPGQSHDKKECPRDKNPI